MFKRFSQEESVSSQGQVKSSVLRGIRSKIVEQYPRIESVLDNILPKKGNVTVVKCQGHCQIVCNNKEPVFFSVRDGPIFPALRLVHQCQAQTMRTRSLGIQIGASFVLDLALPFEKANVIDRFESIIHVDPGFMPEMQVDRGAIRFVLGGAHIMCPGLTSPGGRMDTDLPAGSPVVIKAEGKEMEMAIGLTKMSTGDIRDKNKGIGVELLHYLNDGLWRTTEIS